MRLPPLALYAHIPWCVRKCPYCDFNSHERAGALPENEYVAKLILDLERLLPSVWGRRLVSVFIGGGTPSLFSPEAIDRLLSAVRARLTVEPGAEITLEANPGAAEAARFRGFRGAGVNRLSIGVQSFDERMLAALGASTARTRRGARSKRLAPASTTSTSISCTACPVRRSPWRVRTSRRRRRGVPHISAYQLAIEPNTVFWSRPPQLPAHDECADMWKLKALGEAGFEHYETSAFAKPDRCCSTT